VGTTTADTSYAANAAAARAAGLRVGAYHYANPDSTPNDAVNEADWFLRIATIASGDLVPVLDLEVSNGLSWLTLTAWVEQWLHEVQSRTGVTPLIYASPGFWSYWMGDTDLFARQGNPLWIAHWTADPQPSVPAGAWAGQGWTFWQQSSIASVPGIAGPVDVDMFNGTIWPTSLIVP
jgi:GH25 family lysozyme M1 (1,4-beta-N-acetylmuramidase)